MLKKIMLFVLTVTAYNNMFGESLAPSQWKAEYFNNIYLIGKPFLTQELEAPIKYENYKPYVPGLNFDFFSIRWTGKCTIPADDLYLIKFLSDDGIRIYIDGKLVVNRWFEQKSAGLIEPVYLKKGKHDVKVEFYDTRSLAAVSFDIVPQFGVNESMLEISGKAALPDGVNAVSDKEIIVSATAPDGISYYAYTAIPKGKNSAVFHIPVPSEKKASYTLAYETAADICLGKGYYSPKGTSALKGNAGSISMNGSPVDGITMELPGGLSISGKLAMPDGGNAPAGGITVEMKAVRDNGEEYFLPVTIPAGKNSAVYFLTVPKSENTSMYQLLYSTDNPLYMDWGYYNSLYTASVTGESPWLRVTGKNLKNIDMELIKSGIVMGTISLENNAIAAANMYVTIQGIDVKDIYQKYTRYKTYVTIQKGENSSPFSVKLPANSIENTYFLRYVCNDHGIQRVGYYSKSGTLKFADAKKGMPFDMDGKFYDGIKIGIKKDPGQLSIEEEKEIGLQKAKSIVKENIKPGMTDFEKLMVLHDYLCQNSVYGWDEIDSSLYTILCKGIGECGSHAGAMYEMLTEAGVECKIVYGVGHVWDMVKIDGQWYYHDATFDDNGAGHMDYNCFLLSTEQLIAKGSSWKVGDYPPADKPFVFKESYLPNKKLVKNDQFYRFIGNISLPDGKKAGEGGIEVKVMGNPFLIPAGQNSTMYIVTYHYNLDKQESEIPLIVKNSEGYVSWGYAGKDGYTPYKDQAVIYKKDGQQDIVGLNFTLQKGISVNGKVSLPNGMTAPKEGVNVWINVYDQEKRALAWPSYKIPYGETSAEFSMGVAEGSYYFGVHGVSLDGLFGDSFYKPGGSELFIRDVPAVKIGKSPVNGIDMTLFKGVLVKGTIGLPKGEKAPAGGYKAYPTVWDTSMHKLAYRSLLIPEGSNKIDFTLTAPPVDFSAGTEWGGGDYISQGFYSKSGMVYDSKKAALYPGTPGTAAEGITLVYEKGVIISGKVLLPQGMTAPKDGVKVTVGLYDVNKNRLKAPSYIIPEGASGIDYQIVMPKENPPAKYYLGYIWVKGFVTPGYYVKNKTVFDFKDAVLLDMSKGDIKNADIELYRGFVVSGSFILPKGKTAPEGGLKVSFTKYEEDKTHQSWWSHTIPAGENKLDFTYNFLPGKYYFAYRWVEGYVNPGFYSKKGFTGKIDEAEMVDLTKKDAAGIDLYLYEGAKITGKLSLPKGELAPKDGVKAWVNLYGTNRKAVIWPNFTIPEGQNSADFSFNAEPGIYYIGYNEVVPPQYVNKQLYTGNGMTPYWENAKMLEVTSKGVGGIELPLTKGLKVSGTVSLPKGETAPAGGVSVWINLWDMNKKAMIWPKFTIPEGQNSAGFDLYYLAGEYYLGYNGVAVAGDLYKTRLYYSKEGMADKWNSATPLKVSQDMQGLKLYLEKK
ncbi:MAG: hypothetical protein A2Y33_11950 [Spirochaetes bacterium GWF1_51_8]|nr:MAG: hypothetical protein A2Y33_11950 [Spirochaetes bacterium GWF1_51_8]